jgi:hypothetical protein
MQVSACDFDTLMREHLALMRDHARAQALCTAQARDIARLQAEAMRLRAGIVRRDSALAWAREDHADLERSTPGLASRAALGQTVRRLEARIHELGRSTPAMAPAPAGTNAPAAAPAQAVSMPETQAGLEDSLAAADLVICQAGCTSHGMVWRVQDHCKRTGKTCVLVEAPAALRIVRIVAEGKHA